jgi:hypothetical protein
MKKKQGWEFNYNFRIKNCRLCARRFKDSVEKSKPNKGSSENLSAADEFSSSGKCPIENSYRKIACK